MSDHDALLDRLLPELLSVLRRTQAHTLEGAWELGGLLDAAADESDMRGLIAEAAKALARAGCEISTRNLQAYRNLHRAYEREQLPELLEGGLTLTHLQLLAGLEPELRLRIEQEVLSEEEPAPSQRALRQLIQERRREQTREVSVADAEVARSAAEEDKPLRPAVIDQQAARGVEAPRHAVSRLEEVDETPALNDGDGEPEAADRTVDPEHAARSEGITKAVASGPKGFTQSPLKVVKAADNVAIKMLGQSGDLFLALDEVARYGYDSERSLRNFLEAAQSLDATLASYEQVLPEVRKRLRSALSALHIEG